MNKNEFLLRKNIEANLSFIWFFYGIVLGAEEVVDSNRIDCG